MRIINYIFILLLLIVSIQCQNKQQEMTPSAYVEWIKTNQSLKKEKQIDQFLFSLQYVPNDYSVLRNNNRITKQEYDSLITDYKNFISFIFKVRLIDKEISPLKHNVSNNEEFSMKLQYCSYKISNDFYIVLGNDTIQCINVLMERDYNVSPYNTFILNFESNLLNQSEFKNDLLLIYDDYVWNNGIIKFRIKKKDLENIPKLKLI